MTRSRRYRIFSLMMAFLVAFTSFGYAVDLHFCQGQLKGFSFFGKAKNCHEKMAHCPNHSITLEKDVPDNCCSNKTVQIEDLDEDGLLACDIDLVPDHELSDAAFVVVKDQVANYLKIHKLLLRPPPLIKQTLYLLQESFLL